MANSFWRGYKIHCIGDTWFYVDTGEKVSNNPYRKCGHCNNRTREDGHDSCLGKLPGLMNACCGHGDIEQAYVQFVDGVSINGEDAKLIIEVLKKYNG